MVAGGASQEVGSCGVLALAKKGDGVAISGRDRGDSGLEIPVDYVRGGKVCSVQGRAFNVKVGVTCPQELLAFNVEDLGWSFKPGPTFREWALNEGDVGWGFKMGWGFKLGSTSKASDGSLFGCGLHVVLGGIARWFAWTPSSAPPADRALANAEDARLWAPSYSVPLLTRDVTSWELSSIGICCRSTALCETTSGGPADGGPADATYSPPSLHFGYVGKQVLVGPDPGRGASSVPDLQAEGVACTSIVRCSPRLASKEASSVLDAAMARKARLLDCGVTREGPRKLPSRNKLIGLSRRCGVLLCGGETDSLMEFVAQDLSDAA